MKEKEKDKIHNRLTIETCKYIKAIIVDYGKNIPDDRLNMLTTINDYSQLINIYDYGSINCYADGDGVNMPLCAEKVLKLASKIPGYGINKNHKSFNDDTLINNNNTFINYIYHVFVSGTNTEEYYSDMLLHEVMHFCGSGGATALKEGINELLTRKTALKNGFRTNGCGYPKEVQIAFQLQQLLGEETLDQIAFINDEPQIYNYLLNELDEDAAKLYMNVSQSMQEEFDKKYYSKMDSYNGAIGILKKTANYKKIDYSNVYRMFEEYSTKKSDSFKK